MGQYLFDLITAAITGVAVFLFLTALLMSLRVRPRNEATSTFEAERQKRMCQSSWVWKYFHPLVKDCQSLFKDSSDNAKKLQLALDQNEKTKDWKVPEYLATRLVESFFIGIVFGTLLFPIAGLFISLGVGFGIAVYLFSGAAKSQIRKLDELRKNFMKRLPFAVDLMALMLESGSILEHSLEAVVREEKDHEIGVQFGVVIDDVTLNVPFRQAMSRLGERINDEDVDEFIFAVVKGDELGTPIDETLRNQSDVMKRKRIHRAEKASADAQIKMSGPNFVIMVICILLICGPLVSGAWPSLSELFSGGL